MAASARKGLVLVVEDERADRRPASGSTWPARASACTSRPTAPPALAAARRLRPVAIVLDVGLPGMDGTEVCRRLRADGDWTPVLFVTARDDEVDRVLGLELGADDYVTKPFSPRELVARVQDRAAPRRAGAGRARDRCCTSAGVAVDPASRRVVRRRHRGRR